MKLVYLPVNMAWGFMFCGKLTSMDGQYLFNSRTDARNAARRCGLRVTRTNKVECLP